MEVVNGVRFGVVLGLYPVETAVYIQKVFGCPIRLLNSLILHLFGPILRPNCDHFLTGRKIHDRREFSHPFYCVFGVDLLCILKQNTIDYESKQHNLLCG